MTANIGWILINLWFAIDQTNYRTPIISELSFQSEEQCTIALMDIQRIAATVNSVEFSYAICIREDQINRSQLPNQSNN